MNRSDTLDENLPMPHVEVECRRINRGPHLHSCSSSGATSVISVFCIGLVSGAAGGLLLGATAVIVLQSLELLDENKLLMEKLQKYINISFFSVPSAQYIQMICNDCELNGVISVLVEEFGVFSSTLSLAVGVSIGLSTYSLVIRKSSEAAMGKALVLAGTVCLMGITAAGYVLGLGLENFLSFNSNVSLAMWFFITLPIVLFPQYTLFVCTFCCDGQSYFSNPVLFPCIVLLLTPGALSTIAAITFFWRTKLVLAVALIPTIWAVYLLENEYDFQLTSTPVPLMLIITEIFNIANQPIVNLQSLNSTNTSSAVHEGLFVGLLTSQLFTAAVGLSLFVSWQKGGAGKICASAAGSGAAVLGVIKLALPVLGPGPIIGALVGVAGAVGVSLSAAGAATDHYGEDVSYRYILVGRLGVTVGAAAGAFLSSCSYSGLSGTFMGLCAAALPAGLYLKLMFLFVYRCCRRWNFKLLIFLLCVIILITLLIWFHFACMDCSNGSVVLILLPLLHWCIVVMSRVLPRDDRHGLRNAEGYQWTNLR